MNPYTKGARLLLGLIAAGLILIGGLLGLLEIVNHRTHEVPVNYLKVAFHGLLLLAGLILLAGSSKLAARLTDTDDAEDASDDGFPPTSDS